MKQPHETLNEMFRKIAVALEPYTLSNADTITVSRESELGGLLEPLLNAPRNPMRKEIGIHSMRQMTKNRLRIMFNPETYKSFLSQYLPPKKTSLIYPDDSAPIPFDFFCPQPFLTITPTTSTTCQENFSPTTPAQPNQIIPSNIPSTIEESKVEEKQEDNFENNFFQKMASDLNAYTVTPKGYIRIPISPANASLLKTIDSLRGHRHQHKKREIMGIITISTEQGKYVLDLIPDVYKKFLEKYLPKEITEHSNDPTPTQQNKRLRTETEPAQDDPSKSRKMYSQQGPSFFNSLQIDSFVETTQQQNPIKRP